jgi:hypothetical protein
VNCRIDITHPPPKKRGNLIVENGLARRVYIRQVCKSTSGSETTSEVILPQKTADYVDGVCVPIYGFTLMAMILVVISTLIASLFDISGHSARVRLIGHSIGRKIPIEIGKTIWRTLAITGSGGTLISISVFMAYSHIPPSGSKATVACALRPFLVW